MASGSSDDDHSANEKSKTKRKVHFEDQAMQKIEESDEAVEMIDTTTTSKSKVTK